MGISRNFSKSEITENGDSSPPSQYPPVFETEPQPLDTKPRKKGGFITDENEKPKTQTTEAPKIVRKTRLSMIERAANISNQSTSNQRTSLEGKQRKSMKERKSMSEKKISDPIIDETTIRRLSTKQKGGLLIIPQSDPDHPSEENLVVEDSDLHNEVFFQVFHDGSQRKTENKRKSIHKKEQEYRQKLEEQGRRGTLTNPLITATDTRKGRNYEVENSDKFEVFFGKNSQGKTIIREINWIKSKGGVEFKQSDITPGDQILALNKSDCRQCTPITLKEKIDNWRKSGNKTLVVEIWHSRTTYGDRMNQAGIHIQVDKKTKTIQSEKF